MHNHSNSVIAKSRASFQWRKTNPFRKKMRTYNERTQNRNCTPFLSPVYLCMCVSVLKRWWEVGRRYEVQCGSMAAGGFWLCPSLLVWLVGWLKWLSGGVFNSSWPGWSDDIKTQSNVQNSIQKSLRIVAWLNIERTHINSPTDTQCSTIHASDTNNPANKLE